MKPKLPQPEHYSYQLHRKQRTTQIILPMILSALLFVGMIVWISLATFRQDGDVGRWAAISTIWIVIPIMIAGLIVLAILIGLIYLLARALGGLPYYTGIAQDYVYKARGYIVRAADMAASPIIKLDGWLESIKAFLGRMTP
ncbi:MAG: hypothetical protein HYZ21_16585 [Chloroflexi bacterium]|nr:hypothetical protein [Chloroflexota bacterium]